MNIRKLRKIVAIGLGLILVVGVCGLGFLRWRIQAGLNEWSDTAQEAHPNPGDNAAALIEYVQSESHSLGDRNLAVWALGQTRDERALPVLQAFVTGKECDHSKDLCQYELKKAIELSG